MRMHTHTVRGCMLAWGSHQLLCRAGSPSVRLPWLRTKEGTGASMSVLCIQPELTQHPGAPYGGTRLPPISPPSSSPAWLPQGEGTVNGGRTGSGSSPDRARTYMARYSSKRPLSWMWYIRSPPLRNSITKNRCSWGGEGGEQRHRKGRAAALGDVRRGDTALPGEYEAGTRPCCKGLSGRLRGAVAPAAVTVGGPAPWSGRCSRGG